MGNKVRERSSAMTSLRLRRVRHKVNHAGHSGWVLCDSDWSGEADWMIMAEFSDTTSRHIVHESYRDARVAAGYILEMQGVSFRFPAAVDEWGYDLRSGALSCPELASVA